MTHTDFVRHFRFAANVLGVWEYDESRYPEAELDAAAKRNWRLWLLPELFEGFDPSLWHPLPDQVEKVEEQVALFRNVAEHVRRADSPTDEETAIARESLRCVYRFLRLFLFDNYTLELQRDCRRIVLDPSDQAVCRWAIAADIKLGEDATGEPAVEVWVIVDDSTPDDTRFRSEWDSIRRRVLERLWQRVESDRRVYISLRTVTEAAERMTGVPV